MRRNIARHHRAGTDHATLADRHAADYRHIAAKPAVRADDNRLAILAVVCGTIRCLPHVTILPTQRMHRWQQRNVRAEQHVVANRHRATIQHSEVEVGEHALSDGDVAAIVEENRPHHVKAGTVAGQQLIENRGTGGMITKIRAARVLMLAGIPMVICHGRRQGSLIQLAHGESVGTYFVARNKAHDISPRKLWIALGDTAKGVLVVDDGARRALVDTGSSLLSVGITSVEGSFFRGDIVDIKDQEGHLFARGRVNAPSSEVSLARGRSQKEIRGNELLVNLGDKPAVHRDELVVFE